MKKLNTFTKSIFAVTLFAAFTVPTVNASEVTAQLQMNAQQSLAVTLEENLNQVVLTINGSLEKDMLLSVKNEQSLVLDVAMSQSVKDDKIISSVSE
jgi:hypothetical protein